ncbi:MAG TPA: GNAT family N-acetyltransferase [Acetobacteraceae bacterium]|jgi:GNAT superfamily N-acetyltransferase
MLRLMVLTDAEAVAALVRAAFAAQSVPTDPPASALRLTAADVQAHLARGGGGAVAREAGTLAGSMLWEPKDGGLYVSRVAVAPALRRRGIARALLTAAEDAARGSGLPFLHLATRLVLADNRRLFSACGFVETEQKAHPGYAEPTSVTMMKRLA